MTPRHRDYSSRKKPEPTEVRQALRSGYGTEDGEPPTPSPAPAHVLLPRAKSQPGIPEHVDEGGTAPFDLSDEEANVWRARQAREDVHELARGVGQIRLDMQAGFNKQEVKNAEMATLLRELVDQGKRREDREVAALERREDREHKKDEHALEIRKLEVTATAAVAGEGEKARWTFREKMLAVVGSVLLAGIGLAAKLLG